MTETLLQKAKKVEVRRIDKIKANAQHIELAIAWMNGEINLAQASVALGKKPTNTHILYYFSTWLKEAYKIGLIKIK